MEHVRSRYMTHDGQDKKEKLRAKQRVIIFYIIYYGKCEFSMNFRVIRDRSHNHTYGVRTRTFSRKDRRPCAIMGTSENSKFVHGAIKMMWSADVIPRTCSFHLNIFSFFFFLLVYFSTSILGLGTNFQ